MPAITRLFNFYLKFQDNPLSKMSVAKLKEEGDKALRKEDYDSAVEFYTMVCNCTISAPELNFRSLLNVVFLDIRRGVQV
jgi:hypothetical protein